MTTLKQALNEALRVPEGYEVDQVIGGKYGYHITLREIPATIEGTCEVTQEWSLLDLIDEFADLDEAPHTRPYPKHTGPSQTRRMQSVPH